MEACPKIGMINFEIKSCNYESTDLGEKISQFILTNYQENPESFLKEINEFLKLREDAANASKDIMGLNIIKKYYRQLQFLSNRFPMKSGEQCETEFSWDHLFDEREISHSDIRYEQQCILYNIGSLHSYLGCMDKRMNEEGIRISCNHFQLAAWAFLKIRELYSSYDFTSDLNADIMTFKLNTVLAQAQECLLEKSIMDKRKASIQARISAHIIDLYKLSLTNCEKQEFQSTVGSKQSKDLKQYCQLKIFYYSALMFYFAALNSAEMKKIGEAVGYIQEAEAKCAECTKMKNLKEFQDVLKYTSDLITSKCKALKKENDFVYNEKIVGANELAEIKAASLANPLAINFENDPEIASQDIFTRLVSMQAHELSSLYSEEKAKILRQINGQVEEKDLKLVQFSGALQINELHLKELDHLRLPKELIECCAEVSVKEQTIRQDLVKSMKKIVDSSVQARSLLDEIEQLFETEDRENRQRSDYATDSSSDEENLPIGPRKKKMNDLLDRYDALIKKQDEANRSNGALRDAINAVLSHLQILSLPMSELAQKLPKVEEVCDDESQATRDQLLTLLAKLDEMKSQRAQLLTRIQKAIQDDDITKIIASHQNEIKDINVFFQQQLKKHDQLFTYMNQNLHAQDNILRALADANAAFAVQRQKILQACKNRTDFVNDLTSSYRSIDQLIEKANNGVAFFESLIEPLKNLLRDVTDFCSAQKKERQKFSHKNNISAPQVQHFEPLVNPYRKEVTVKANINQEVSMDRPRLKDFLPIMKPETWGQNKTRPNLPSFPNDVNQQFQSFTPNMNKLNEPSVTPNPAVNFLNQPRSNQLAKKGPSKNPALNFAQKMPEVDKNKFEYDINYQIAQSGLSHEQLVKENEMKMRQKQLEQQELQLKNMQHQFQQKQKEQEEQKKQQQVIFDQQRQPQNYWNGQNQNQNYQAQFNNHIYNQQYPNAYGHGQGGSDVNKNVSSTHTMGPQLPMNNVSSNQQYPNAYGHGQGGSDVNKNVSSTHPMGPQLPINNVSSNQQYPNAYGHGQGGSDVNKNVSSTHPMGPQLPINNVSSNQQYPNAYGHGQGGSDVNKNVSSTHPMGPQLPMNNVSQNNQFSNGFSSNYYVPKHNPSDPSKIFDELKPDSVYKPGYLSQIKLDSFSSSSLANQPYNQTNLSLNQNLAFNQSYLNFNQSGQLGSNFPSQNFPQSNTVPAKPAQQNVVNQPSQITTEKKTSIDDLLDIFNSPNSNLSVQPALVPMRIDASQIDGKTVDTHSDPVPITDQCTQPESQVNKIDKELSKMSVSSPIEPNLSTQPNCGFNILSKENKMEKFISEVNKFEHHVNCLNNKTLSYGTVLDKEWKELNDHQDKTSSQMTISIARLNPHQNRYQDLLPFDQTRVCLQAKQNDYINASHLAQINQDLDPLHKQANFVVTQLPMKDFGDFWNMVIQEQCEILVNLCRDNELNQSLYFPLDKQNTLLVAGVNVQLQSFKETNCSIQRVFTLQKDSQTRTVVMLQFKWDNSKSPSITSVTGIAQNEMPDNVATFLKFVKECENFYLKEQRNRNKPILVHCMNGVSRSAVFILLYSMIQIVDTICQSDCFMAQFNSDLVLRSIKQMRAKRKYMIQSTYHLKYSYDAILYYMKDLLIKQGVFVSNETNFERRNSNIETSILNDQSVVSIQSTRVEKNGTCLSVNDIVDFGKFNLDLDDVKRKTSKRDFLDETEKKVTENDPFGWLDPLK